MACPNCPKCGRELSPNEYPYGFLNEEQWDAVRAGDFVCEHCTGTRSSDGKRYYWEHELVEKIEQ